MVLPAPTQISPIVTMGAKKASPKKGGKVPKRGKIHETKTVKGKSKRACQTQGAPIPKGPGCTVQITSRVFLTMQEKVAEEVP